MLLIVTYVHILLKLIQSILSSQEILLRRSSKDEKLGLTLCYETDADDGTTEVFIDDIHPDGLAARDGRLELGDEIIQVRKTKLL